MDLQYVDPVLSLVDNPKSIQDLTQKFSSYHTNITKQCSSSLKIYRKLLDLQYKVNSWEFMALKTSINLNFFNQDTSNQTGSNREFDINIAKKVMDRCNEIDEEINGLDHKISFTIKFISGLTIQEYISDPGCLLLKIYFKTLNTKNELVESLSVYYTKSKLLIISYELTQIMEMIDEDENPIVPDNTDFQSTLRSYKEFVSVLIDQLDKAVIDKDSEQIQECLGILNDVEKMYESVKMNFFVNEEFNEWEREREEEEQFLLSNSMEFSSVDSNTPNSTLLDDSDDEQSYTMSKYLKQQPHHHRPRLSRKNSMSSTTSSLNTFKSHHNTTISEELPYLLQAFDEAKHLEEELSTYQVKQKKILKNNTSSNANLSNSKSPSSSTILESSEKPRSTLQPGFSTPNMGFSSNLLNNLYGLHPNKMNSTQVYQPSNLHNEVD